AVTRNLLAANTELKVVRTESLSSTSRILGFALSFFTAIVFLRRGAQPSPSHDQNVALHPPFPIDCPSVATSSVGRLFNIAHCAGPSKISDRTAPTYAPRTFISARKQSFKSRPGSRPRALRSVWCRPSQPGCAGRD